MNLVDLVAHVRSGIVQIELERDRYKVASGSGFLVEGGLVTNSHVLRVPSIDAVCFRPADADISDPTSCIRMLPENCYQSVIAESPEELGDYVYIRFQEREFDGMHRFAFSSDCVVSVGEQVVYLGYPFGLVNLAAHVGYVSSVYARRDGTRVYQIDGSVNGGNSGGPLLNLDGSVVGIVTRAYTGLIEEQFGALLKALRANQEALKAAQGIMSVGGVDPMDALRASQAAMERIATDLHRSANVGIGYAYSADEVKRRVEKARGYAG
jgi:V8-like Glu-specific endopeptidase